MPAGTALRQSQALEFWGRGGRPTKHLCRGRLDGMACGVALSLALAGLPLAAAPRDKKRLFFERWPTWPTHTLPVFEAGCVCVCESVCVCVCESVCESVCVWHVWRDVKLLRGDTACDWDCVPRSYHDMGYRSWSLRRTCLWDKLSHGDETMLRFLLLVFFVPCCCFYSRMETYCCMMTLPVSCFI